MHAKGVTEQSPGTCMLGRQEAVASIHVPGPPYTPHCMYGLRVRASCVPAQRSSLQASARGGAYAY